jgi:hypothetical protein
MWFSTGANISSLTFLAPRVGVVALITSRGQILLAGDAAEIILARLRCVWSAK